MLSEWDMNLLNFIVSGQVPCSRKKYQGNKLNYYYRKEFKIYAFKMTILKYFDMIYSFRNWQRQFHEIRNIRILY